ncbi:hypothetical protein V8F06_006908 [Rhypophila decipiens]
MSCRYQTFPSSYFAVEHISRADLACSPSDMAETWSTQSRRFPFVAGGENENEGWDFAFPWDISAVMKVTKSLVTRRLGATTLGGCEAPLSQRHGSPFPLFGNQNSRYDKPSRPEAIHEVMTAECPKSSSSYSASQSPSKYAIAMSTWALEWRCDARPSPTGESPVRMSRCMAEEEESTSETDRQLDVCMSQGEKKNRDCIYQSQSCL